MTTLSVLCLASRRPAWPDIAGCVQTLLSRGSLDGRRESILKMRMDQLSIVLPLLTDEDAHAYYERLHIMGGLASGWQRDGANLA